MEKKFMILGIFWVVLGMPSSVHGEISKCLLRKIDAINKQGPYFGIVVPNTFEMDPLLQSPSFKPNNMIPYMDALGKRFRFGKVENKEVIIVMSGMGTINAGITTELLLTLFKVKGVLHHGVAGNANSELQIGDVTIPKYWAHSGLWVWQRHGDGPEDELPLESSDDFIRTIGQLEFSNYNNVSETNETTVDNFLNRIWYQEEEVFPIDGTPEVRQRAFWVPVDSNYYALSSNLTDLSLGRCVNSTCLPRASKVWIVERGLTANIYVDNKAYSKFLNSKFNAAPIDMESAAIALVCYQQKIPFISFRSLSDLAGGGTSLSNEVSIFSSLAAQNVVDVLIRFMQVLS